MASSDMPRSGGRVPGAIDGSLPAVVALVAGASAGAGVVHFTMVPVHAGDGLLDPVGFALFGWFQVAVAVALVARGASRRLLVATGAGNAVAAALWLWSRTAGLPFGTHSGVAEDAAAIDVITVSLEAVAILGVVWMLVAPRRAPLSELASVVLGVSALALATVGIVVPESGEGASHSHHVGETAASEDGDHGDVVDASAGEAAHAHDAVSAEHLAAMARIDEERCDWSMNPQAYWDEAGTLGVDVHGGGSMAAADHTASTDTLEVSGATGSASPLGGRGSEALDRLVSLTTRATSEVAAAVLVAELSEASGQEYAAWLAWVGANQAGHAHGSGGAAAAPEDTGGHGGHIGPHPWEALVDTETCELLASELATAQDVALRHPTAQDAMDAGWVKVTPYLPGIAAHYMNFGYVDGRFSIEEPEMILYDGEGPDAHVVGLSYYVVLEGEAEPTQGFTGNSDHFHRHVGLCVAGTLVVGDSTTTDEQCAALGGTKQGGSDGWMNHVWVVPGCESPWGVFSGANPILDARVGAESGAEGGCAASGARDRYDLSPGKHVEVDATEGTEEAVAEG